jgi:hypothetical protein
MQFLRTSLSLKCWVWTNLLRPRASAVGVTFSRTRETVHFDKDRIVRARTGSRAEVSWRTFKNSTVISLLLIRSWIIRPDGFLEISWNFLGGRKVADRVSGSRGARCHRVITIESYDLEKRKIFRQICVGNETTFISASVRSSKQQITLKMRWDMNEDFRKSLGHSISYRYCWYCYMLVIIRLYL